RVRLGERVTGAALAPDHGHQVALALLVVGVVQDGLGAAAEEVHRRVLEQLLDDEAHRELAHAVAAELLRDVQRPELSGLGLLVERVPFLDREAALQKEVVLERHELPLAKLANDVDDHVQLIGEMEVHPGLSRGRGSLRSYRMNCDHISGDGPSMYAYAI